MKNRFFTFRRLILLSAIIIFTVFSSQAFARGFRGGFRSFGRGFHFSVPARRGSFSRGFSWGGRRSSGFRTSGRRGAGTLGSRFSSGAAMRRADKALYERAKSRGTLFSNKRQALDAFRRRYRNTYRNKFSTRPSVRPPYIPNSYTAPNGSRYSVVYRPSLGGYGYYNPSLGRWMLYSVMADAAMTNLLMRNNGYYYGPSPGYAGGGGSMSLGSIVFLALLGIAAARMVGIRRGC